MVGLRCILDLLLVLGITGQWLHLLGMINQIKLYHLVPLSLLAIYKITVCIREKQEFNISALSRPEKVLIAIVCLQIGFNSLGILVPETAFDALWYHLPQALVYAQTGSVQPIPELLYSTMPRLGEMYYTIGFLVNQSSIASKTVSFIASLLYLVLSYALARQYLTRPYSLIAVAIINSQVVLAWQAASGYVDIHRAVFELAALSCLALFAGKSDRRWLFLAGGFTGLALSVKMLALTSFIAGLILISLHAIKNKYSLQALVKYLLIFSATVLIVALPWYLVNFLETGNPFYPTNLVEKQVDQLTHAGATSRSRWLTGQLVGLPLLPWKLTFQGTGVLTSALLILLPFLVWQLKNNLSHHLPLLSYITCSLVLWWFIPPPESRYLLATIPPLIIMSLWSLNQLKPQFRLLKITAITSLLIGITINFSVRIGASTKFIPYLSGQISKYEYIKSQTTNFNRTIVEKFYSGYWSNYHYPD
jgi:hypothetical protein